MYLKNVEGMGSTNLRVPKTVEGTSLEAGIVSPLPVLLADQPTRIQRASRFAFGRERAEVGEAGDKSGDVGSEPTYLTGGVGAFWGATQPSEAVWKWISGCTPPIA